MSAELPSSLVLLGAGKMGQAMLSGWLAHGLEASRVTAIDPHLDEEGRALLAEKGRAPRGRALRARRSPRRSCSRSSRRPWRAPHQGARDLIGEHTARLVDPRRKAHLRPCFAPRRGRQASCAPCPIRRRRSRAASARRGRGARPTARQRAMANALFGCIGRVEWVEEEALIDAVTAVSGSGPAYVFLLVECLAEAGAKAGLAAGPRHASCARDGRRSRRIAVS